MADSDFATQLRLFRTWERLNGCLLTLQGSRRALEHVFELAEGDLTPELAEADARLVELVGHLESASNVLHAKIALSYE